MNAIKSSILLLLALLTVASCSVHKTQLYEQHPFINMKWEDMEYVRDVQDTTVQSYLLGFIPIGGNRFRKASLVNANIINLPSIRQRRGLRNALYNIIQQTPDADFVIPTYQYSRIDRMFLGKKEYLTLRVKAFRIKSKEPEVVPADTAQ